MKGLLISIALLVGAAIYLITAYDTLGENYLAKALVEEGTPEQMQEALAKDEAAFVAKYRPFITARWNVAHGAMFLDDNYFLKVSKDSLDRYRETPLNKDPGYGNILFQRAQMMEQRSKPPIEAFNLFKEYTLSFPGTPEYAIARSATQRMAISYGMQ